MTNREIIQALEDNIARLKDLANDCIEHGSMDLAMVLGNQSTVLELILETVKAGDPSRRMCGELGYAQLLIRRGINRLEPKQLVN